MVNAEELFFKGLSEKKAEASAPAVEVQKPRAVTPKNIFANPDAHPIALDMVLLKEFKLEWFTWLSDTLMKEIEHSFNTSIAEINRIKIMAVQSLHVIDTFWDHWEIFEKTIITLNDGIPILDFIQPLSVQQLMAGVDIVSSIREETYSEEVARYAAACFLHDNVHYAPPPMSFCQQYISQPMYRCKDCDKKSSALPPFDGYCSSCTQKFEKDKPFDFKPNKDLINKGLGKNLDFFNTYDPIPTKKRFEELNKLPPEQLHIKEEPLDVEAARLIVATDYMNFKRQQLKEQLGSIKDWLVPNG